MFCCGKNLNLILRRRHSGKRFVVCIFVYMYYLFSRTEHELNRENKLVFLNQCLVFTDDSEHHNNARKSVFFLSSMLTVDFMNHAPILKSEEIKIQANQIVTVERVWRAFAIENVNSLTHDMYPLLSLRRIPFHLVVGLRAKRTMAQSLRWRARTPNVCTRKFKQIYQRLEIHTYQRHIYQSTTRNRRATMNHQPRLCARARIFVHSHTLSQLQFVAIKCKLRETKTKRNKRNIYSYECLSICKVSSHQVEIVCDGSLSVSSTSPSSGHGESTIQLQHLHYRAFGWLTLLGAVRSHRHH